MSPRRRPRSRPASGSARSPRRRSGLPRGSSRPARRAHPRRQRGRWRSLGRGGPRRPRAGHVLLSRSPPRMSQHRPGQRGRPGYRCSGRHVLRRRSTLIIGSGSRGGSFAARSRHRGTPRPAAAAIAQATDAASTALAPSRSSADVPSRARRSSSMLSWSPASAPRSASAISSFTCATADCVPLPAKRSAPSRSSCASCVPTDAPEGTIASPSAPPASVTTHATVGVPRESSASQARTRSIVSAMPTSLPAVESGVRSRPRVRAPAMARPGTLQARGRRCARASGRQCAE